MTGVRTVTLTEFLLARIADDEAVARKYRPHEYLTTRDGSELSGADQGGNDAIAITSGRVLAECDAKRQIVALHDADADGRFCLSCGDGDYYGVGYPCPTARALALPYADHPDYRDEWKP